MKVRTTLLTLLLFLVVLTIQAQWEPQTVINQRTIDNSYVSDADGNLDATEIAQLNQILQQTENETGVQFAIVVLNDISEKWEIMGFGVELFNHWGIGQKDTDKGLLLLIVKNTRDWRFFSGYGLEGTLPDAVLNKLGYTYIVPAFQAENYGNGLIDVSNQINHILTDKNVAEAARYAVHYEPWWDTFQVVLWIAWFAIMGLAFYAMTKKRKKQTKAVTAVSPFKTDAKATDMVVLVPDKAAKVKIWGNDKAAKFLSVFGMAGLVPGLASYYSDLFSNPVGNAVFGFYIYLFVLSGIIQYRLNRNAKRLSPDGPSGFLTLTEANKLLVLRMIFFPMAFLPYYFIYKKKLNRLKNEKITCRQCQLDAFPLLHADYGQHLSQAEMLEIKLKSRDTRLYQCANAHLTKILFAGKKAAAFRTCQKCHTLTMAKTSEKTIQAATYSSSGQGEREFTCKNCGATMLAPFVIPMKQRSSSSSGSGSSGSGGGSWGGGSTGGGGAGGKW
ncbi:MAG: TPM domain-containing protein [Lentimicrobium sp.]|jgi:uncharacterized protein|nr:TPM domain-containing protein [Lentimicrobium sp.]